MGRWQGWIVSVLVHLLFLMLVVMPVLRSDFDPKHTDGAGGAQPAGGGGGGANGRTAGPPSQRLQFFALAAAAVHSSQQVVQAPQPVVPPLKPLIATPTPPPPIIQTPNVSSATSPQGDLKGAASAGSNAGVGAGSGTGGGVGSGEGGGRGTGTGRGTGGGNAQIYPPKPRQLFMPPLPAPRALHGFRLIAWFDVDSAGKAHLLRFTPSPDNGYNKLLRETLLGMKFYPAVRPDGVPVRDTVDIQFLFGE
jgi:hypothetical protein